MKEQQPNQDDNRRTRAVVGPREAGTVPTAGVEPRQVPKEDKGQADRPDYDYGQTRFGVKMKQGPDTG